MTTFREQRIADIAGVFMNNDDFAEDVTYIPKSGSSRPVQCIVEAEQEYFDGDQSTEKLERLRVFVDKTATGIPTPVIGDSVLRSATFDPEQRRYGHSGDIEFKEPESHWVIFTRKRQSQFGISQKGARP